MALSHMTWRSRGKVFKATELHCTSCRIPSLNMERFMPRTLIYHDPRSLCWSHRWQAALASYHPAMTSLAFGVTQFAAYLFSLMTLAQGRPSRSAVPYRLFDRWCRSSFFATLYEWQTLIVIFQCTLISCGSIHCAAVDWPQWFGTEEWTGPTRLGTSYKSH